MYAKLLATELLNNEKELNYLTKENEELKLKAAMFKAKFFHKWDLSEKLDEQINMNWKALRNGVFDGMCIACYNNVTYRTLEDMLYNKILTKEEYEFCLV